MARQTSINVYNDIISEGLLTKRRLEVYKCLYNSGPLTGAQVATLLRRPGSVSETVRNRITELVKQGVVYEVAEVVCPITGRNVLQFDVTDKRPVDLPRQVTRKEKINEIAWKIELIANRVTTGVLLRDDLKRIISDLKQL